MRRRVGARRDDARGEAGADASKTVRGGERTLSASAAGEIRAGDGRGEATMGGAGRAGRTRGTRRVRERGSAGAGDGDEEERVRDGVQNERYTRTGEIGRDDATTTQGARARVVRASVRERAGGARGKRGKRGRIEGANDATNGRGRD